MLPRAAARARARVERDAGSLSWRGAPPPPRARTSGWRAGGPAGATPVPRLGPATTPPRTLSPLLTTAHDGLAADGAATADDRVQAAHEPRHARPLSPACARDRLLLLLPTGSPDGMFEAGACSLCLRAAPLLTARQGP